jgi:hypothetical protein
MLRVNLTNVLLLKGLPCLANDACATAMSITSVPYNVTGTHDFSSVESRNSSAYSCDQLEENTRTNWFMVKGSGRPLLLSLTSDYSTFIGVYEGDCNSLSCVGQAKGAEYLSWTTSPGQVYYIMIGSQSLDSSGQFEMSLEVVSGALLCVCFNCSA